MWRNNKLIVFDAIISPGYLMPGNFKSWSRYQLILILILVRLVRNRENGEYDVMVGENEGVAQFAHDVSDFLWVGKNRRVQEYINIAVEGTRTYKVVICLVQQLDIGELEVRDEVLKEGDSFLILDINISVSSDKKKGICVLSRSSSMQILRSARADTNSASLP